jgi:hypothetical protein
VNCLELIQEMCGRTGIRAPATITATVDPQIRQLRSLLNEELEELSARGRLQPLTAIATFTTVNGEVQGDLDTLAGSPVDYVLNSTMWNRTTKLPVWGPVRPQLWEWYKALPVTGTLYQYRLLGNEVLFMPPGVAGDTIAFEFMRKYPVQAADQTWKQFFTIDTDTTPIPDKVMLAGLRWRWKREKGLQYAEDKERYNQMVAALQLRNETAAVLDLAGRDAYLPAGIVVPLNNWNLP